MAHRLRRQNGQGMVEYLVLVAFIAVGATAVVKILGQNIAAQFNNVSKLLRNESGPTHMDRPEDRHIKQKNFNDFFAP